MNPATTTAPAQQTANGAPAAPLQPFVRGAFEHVEPVGLDVAFTPGANSVLLGQFDIPAFGFLRNVLLFVQATGGTGTAAVYKEDAPWAILSEVVLSDVNGAPIVGPITGYELYLIHKYGGYVGAADPTRQPSYVAPATSGNFAFWLRIPVEIGSRDALGSLPNQNASATYKLRLTGAAKTDVYSTDPSGMPSVRVRGYIEAWSQPAPTDLTTGRQNAQTPPALGTTQFWSKQVFTINNGQNTVRLNRVGNLIRQLHLIFRTTSPARANNYPDPGQWFIDSKLLFNYPAALSPVYMEERQISATVDTGVQVWDWCHDFDGLLGGEMRDQYLPTTQATRLELQGSFASAGTLVVLTNDVAPAGDIYGV